MVKESDIFGGVQWSKEEQFEDELNALGTQMRYTIMNYRKLKRGEEKALQAEIDNFIAKMKSGNCYLRHEGQK